MDCMEVNLDSMCANAFFHRGRLVSSCIIMQQADPPGTSARTGIVVMFHDLWQNFGGIKWSSDTSTFWYRNLSYMSFFIKNNAYIIPRAICGLSPSSEMHILLSFFEYSVFLKADTRLISSDDFM